MTLKEYIQLRQITVAQCAKELGVEPFTIMRWISGTRIPRAKMFVKLAEWSNKAVMPTDFYSQKMSKSGECADQI